MDWMSEAIWWLKTHVTLLHYSLTYIKDRPWCRALPQHGFGSVLGPSSLHVDVSPGKILNPKLFQIAAPVVRECVIEWVNAGPLSGQ